MTRYGSQGGEGIRFRSNSLLPFVSLAIIIGVVMASWGFFNSTFVNHGQDYTSSSVGHVTKVETYKQYIQSQHPDANGPENDNTFVVSIEFEANGRTYTAHSFMRESLIKEYSVGNIVTIVYDPSNPQHSGIEGKVQSGSMLANISFFAGIILIIAAIVMGIKQVIGMFFSVKERISQEMNDRE